MSLSLLETHDDAGTPTWRWTQSSPAWFARCVSHVVPSFGGIFFRERKKRRSLVLTPQDVYENALSLFPTWLSRRARDADSDSWTSSSEIYTKRDQHLTCFSRSHVECEIQYRNSRRSPSPSAPQRRPCCRSCLGMSEFPSGVCRIGSGVKKGCVSISGPLLVLKKELVWDLDCQRALEGKLGTY